MWYEPKWRCLGLALNSSSFLEKFCTGYFAIPLLLLVTAGLYGHTLHVPFYLDDNALFNGTYLLRDLPAAASKLFSQRGLTNLTFAVNYRLVADWSLSQLHLVNITLHAGCGLLVWLLLRQLISSFALPLCGALLFVAHPLQTQAVTYLAQRSTVLAAFLALLAFYCHLRARDALVAAAGHRIAAYRRWYLATVLAGGCAVLAKENAATLPLLLIAYDLLFPRVEQRTLRQVVLDYSPLFVVPLVLGGMALAELAAVSTIAQSPYPLESLRHNSALNYLVTQFSVVWVYLRLLVFPYGQALEHDYPVVADLFSLRSGVALLGLLAVAWLVWGLRRQRPLLTFGVVWFFLALAVESSIIPLDPLFEHRLYLPMFGFLLVLLDGLPTLLGERRAMLALGLALLICLPLSWRRNALWNDPITFYEDNLRVVPNSERAMVDLAARYEAAGLLDQRHALLEEATRIRPRNHDFIIAMAESDADRGAFDAALARLEHGLGMMPDNLVLYEAAALIAERAGRRELIFAYLQRGLDSATASKWRLLNDLGIYQQQDGDLRTAEASYRQSLALYPDNPVAYQYLGGLYFAQGRWEEALSALRQANRLEPGNPETLEGLGKTALKLGDFATAGWAVGKLRHSDPLRWRDLQATLRAAPRDRL